MQCPNYQPSRTAIIRTKVFTRNWSFYFSPNKPVIRIHVNAVNDKYTFNTFSHHFVFKAHSSFKISVKPSLFKPSKHNCFNCIQQTHIVFRKCTFLVLFYILFPALRIPQYLRYIDDAGVKRFVSFAIALLEFLFPLHGLGLNSVLWQKVPFLHKRTQC